MTSAFLGGVNLSGVPATGYPSDALLEDVSRQMSVQMSRRLSRGSNGQRAGHSLGHAMRVTKPTSANNSPRSSMASRRRTYMGDGSAGLRRKQQMDAVYLPTPAPEPSRDYFTGQSMGTTTRPVSWHPSNAIPLCQGQHMQHLPNWQDYAYEQDFYANMPQYSPIHAAYSCQNSPSSTYSPLSLPYSTLDAPHAHTGGWDSQRQTPISSVPSAYSAGSTEPFPTMPCHSDEPITRAQQEWNSFMAGGFNGCPSPPTPEDVSVGRTLNPAVTSDRNLLCERLEEADLDGEILVGMGLYDTPDKPALGDGLLFGGFGSPLSTGRGLKLEDTWNPPAKLDEDDDAEQDADGDE